MTVDLSICVVNYKAGHVLEDCLKSIYQNTYSIQFEIMVVDNNSQDGTVEAVTNHFPKIHLIINEKNVGFSRANNQALRASKGKYILWLNPDTVLLPNALDTLVEFMTSCPEVGIVGPKVLNSDGTLQGQCRRGLPTPWAIFCYLSGLSKLFPKNKRFAQYLMTYRDENVSHEVNAVSGSCLMVRREVMDQIGLLDEDYFMYGEDLDYCLRAKQAGWKVYYVPQAQVIHYGGAASKKRPFRATYEFHRAMWVYYRKHLAQKYLFFINWLIFGAIILRGASAMLINLFRAEKVPGSKKPKAHG
jgi:GT2 family glycosyltransferase